MVKNLPSMPETWVRSLGQEDKPWKRKWQPTPVFLPGEFHGQKGLAGYTVHAVTKSQTQLSTHTYMHTAGFCLVEDFTQENT